MEGRQLSETGQKVIFRVARALQYGHWQMLTPSESLVLVCLSVYLGSQENNIEASHEHFGRTVKWKKWLSSACHF